MTMSVGINPNALEEARADVIVPVLRRVSGKREAPTRSAQKPTPFESTTSFRPTTRISGPRDTNGLRAGIAMGFEFDVVGRRRCAYTAANAL